MEYYLTVLKKCKLRLWTYAKTNNFVRKKFAWNNLEKEINTQINNVYFNYKCALRDPGPLGSCQSRGPVFSNLEKSFIN